MSEEPASSPPRRPTLAVATVGHARHGKTTLTAAISRVLAAREGGRAWSVAELDHRSGCMPLVFAATPGWLEGPTETLTVMPTSLRYATERRVYTHIDGPGRRPWLKNAARAQALVDALIVVVSAPDSVQPQTHEHLRLARALGISQLVVFINKCDAVRDAEWIDLVEHDVRELLVRCGFDGDATRIVRGAARPASLGDPAWEASVVDLIDALDVELATPPRTRDGAPLLHVHHAFRKRMPGGGVLINGRVRRGVFERGAPLRLVGGTELEVKIADIEVDHRKAPRAEAGEFVGLHLSGPGARFEVATGAALVTGAPRATTRISAQIELLATDAGGRPTAIRDGHSALLIFGAVVRNGRLHLPQGQPLAPGEAATVEIELRDPAYLEVGMRFALRDGSQGAWRPGSPALWGGLCGSGEVLTVGP